MWSKNSKSLTKPEKKHLEAVRALACSVCDAPGPSAAHHIKQGRHFAVVALCWACHQGPLMGWHGQRKAWIINKMEEIDALNITLSRVNT